MNCGLHWTCSFDKAGLFRVENYGAYARTKTRNSRSQITKARTQGLHEQKKKESGQIGGAIRAHHPRQRLVPEQAQDTQMSAAAGARIGRPPADRDAGARPRARRAAPAA